MFNLKNRNVGNTDAAPDPNWARDARDRFYRFTALDPEEEGLTGVPGVFVIWHGGVRPEWLFVANSGNLAFDLHKQVQNEELMDYESRGGLFVTWSLIRDEKQAGVVRFLTDTLSPVLENPELPGKDISPIPVALPATG